jgi:uncharacterized oligopeptide transporter (OPT) family protein
LRVCSFNPNLLSKIYSISSQAMPRQVHRRTPGVRNGLSLPNSSLLASGIADSDTDKTTCSLRSILLGLSFGVILCFSNIYFGLQTGIVNTMETTTTVGAFAFFKAFASRSAIPFTPMENVVVQTTASACAGMSLTAGFTGVIPALEFLTGPRENGPMKFKLWQLIVWSLGICFFGVVFAVPLRRRFIVHERLRFPTGTATAVIVGVLHGNERIIENVKRDREGTFRRGVEETVSLDLSSSSPGIENQPDSNGEHPVEEQIRAENVNSKGSIQRTLKNNISLMFIGFIVSGFYVSLLVMSSDVGMVVD